MRTLIASIIGLSALTSLGSAQVAQQSSGDHPQILQLTSASAAAKAAFWNGLDHWQNYGYTAAQQYFDSSVALDPNFGLARVFAAEARVQRGYALERSEMERGVADAARASTGEGLVALAWREKAAGRESSAAALLQLAMKLLPNEPHLASEYVWSLAANDVKAALEAARGARARFPTFGALSPVLVATLMQSGDTVGALAEAQLYTQLDSTHPASFVLYGRLLQGAGRYAEAETEYRRSLALLPLHADFSYNGVIALAELMVLESKPDAAREVISDALRRVTWKLDSLQYLQALGGTQLFAGDEQGALRTFAQMAPVGRALSTEPEPDYPWLLSALTKAAFGDGLLVAQYLTNAGVGAARDSLPMAMSLVGIFAYAGQVDSTLKYANRLAASASTNELARQVAHFARGELYLRTRHCDKALEEFRQSDSTWVEVQSGTAECELVLGHRDVALRWRDRVRSRHDVNLMDPGEIRAWLRMQHWP